jgi:hypothetical protein
MSQITDESHTTTPTQKRFYASEQYAEAREALARMMQSPTYNTASASEDAASFVERHLLYLSKHPLVKLEGYISNLKLMTRAK